MPDLSWIDLIPVNNKIHNLLCIIKKNWGFMMPPLAPRITVWENGEGVNAAGNPPDRSGDALVAGARPP
jgi:hypothetical protein